MLLKVNERTNSRERRVGERKGGDEGLVFLFVLLEFGVSFKKKTEKRHHSMIDSFVQLSLPFMPPSPPNGDRVVVDHFGFELPDLTPEQASARRACHAEASRRGARPEWAALNRDRLLPPRSELKKLARKVRCRWLAFIFRCRV